MTSHLTGRLVVLGALAALAGAPARGVEGPRRCVSPGRLEVEQLARAEVAGPALTLADVAQVRGADQAAVEALRAVPLGAAPRPSGVLRVGRTALVGLIRARAGVDPARLAWTGPASTEVRRAAARVTGAALRDAAVSAYLGAAAARGLEAQAGAAMPPRDVLAPPGEVALAARAIPAEALLARAATVLIDVSAAGRSVVTVPVTLEVRVTGPAAVARRPLTPGEPVLEEAIEVRSVAWTGLTSPPLEAGALAGLRLRRPLRPGEPLKQADVEPAPQVTRGSTATLRAWRGAVEVESRVEVLQDGRLGERVRVKAPSSSSPVLARVSGPGALEVEP